MATRPSKWGSVFVRPYHRFRFGRWERVRSQHPHNTT